MLVWPVVYPWWRAVAERIQSAAHIKFRQWYCAKEGIRQTRYGHRLCKGKVRAGTPRQATWDLCAGTHTGGICPSRTKARRCTTRSENRESQSACAPAHPPALRMEHSGTEVPWLLVRGAPKMGLFRLLSGFSAPTWLLITFLGSPVIVPIGPSPEAGDATDHELANRGYS
jgi:hypothetical protein